MSFTGGALECLLCLGCTRWIWKRCTYVGAYDSASWALASADELAPVPRLCRLILANYEDDLKHPRFQPAVSMKEDGTDSAAAAAADQQQQAKGPSSSSSHPSFSFEVKPEWVLKRVTYEDAQGHCPPYLIYLDHDHKELVFAIRGLNLLKESDYKVLLDNSLGRQGFDGGYVHHGLLKAAVWALNRESSTLRDTLRDLGPGYRLVFTGHSLGSGVAALMAVLVANNLSQLGGIPRSHVTCYSIAPARCMSLNLAVKYADVIHSVILQDDFLPRTATPLEHIFSSIFCLPCFLFLFCLRDTFVPEYRKLNDPRRLYAPGRMYHIVERKFCRCGRFAPEVRTAVPVEGRFEHIVLSCNATKDHGIIWIEREARKALENIRESGGGAGSPPPVQRMERLETLKKEHEDAWERIMTLAITNEESEDVKDHEDPDGAAAESDQAGGEEGGGGPLSIAAEPHHVHSGSVKWDELVQRLFDRKGSGKLVLKKERR